MNQSGYIPGICNIGKQEVAWRKAAFYLGFMVAIGVVVYNLLVPLTLFNLLTLFAISIFTAINFQQYRNRFCIKYGWWHQYNFGKRGMKQIVADKDQRKSDRKKVLEIIVKAIVFAILFVAVICFFKMELGN